MREASLKAEIWVKAQIRICDRALLPAVISRRGDADAGSVLLKLIRSGACCEVYTQVRDQAGQRAWMRATGPEPVPENQADAFIAKQVGFDPDAWVLEIEDPRETYELDGAIIE